MASSSESKRKQSSRMASDCSINGRSKCKLSDFPLDIIFNILSRLPADTLVRLRSVCKLWNKLVRDPDFIDLHLSKWIHIPPSRLIFAPVVRHCKTRSLFLVDGIEEGDWRTRQIQVEYLLGNKLGFVGSCYGLICMATLEKLDPIFICNPITGESMCLPKSNLLGTGFESRFCTFGFGFDHATKKFKVVRVICYPSNGQFLGEVITLGESSWRKKDIPTDIGIPTTERWYGDMPMLFLNGFVYWLVHKFFRGWRRGNEFILAFDIGSETFGTIKVPYLGYEFLSRLIDIKGSLGLVTVPFVPFVREVPGAEKIAKIWRIVGSMATGFSFEQSSYDVYYHPGDTGVGFASLYALLSDGTLLLECSILNAHFALYNPTKKKYLRVNVFEDDYVYSRDLFIPSLVSLNDIY